MCADPGETRRGVDLGGRAIGDVAAFQERLVAGAGIEFRAGIGLQLCQPAGMIEMGMTVQKNFHVVELEAERLNVLLD